MKSFTSCLITICLLITMSANGFTTTAQQSNKEQDPFATPRAKQKEFLDNLPESIKRGASPEAREAWEKLTPQQREEVKTRVDKIFAEAKEKAEKEHKDKGAKPAQKVERKAWKDIMKGKQTSNGIDVTMRFTDQQGGEKFIKAKEEEGVVAAQSEERSVVTAQRPACDYCEEPCYDCDPDPCYDCYPTPTPTPTPAPTPTGEDADGDGLPESFENQLADAFTPIYHVSGYESDHFATFANSVTQTIQQRLGPNPFSYFRVTPLGFAYNYNNQLVSVLRIDYLALWDEDSGLAGGGNCEAFPGLTAFEGILGHELDNERSAVLVAAPVGNQTYNLNPWAYSAYSYYTAAHEYAFNDKSRYADFWTNPVPAGLHIHLALSLSKHATYTFNPDFLTLIPDYIIYSIIAGVDYYCYRSTFDGDFGYNDLACLAAMYYAYGALYGCAVERFYDQGGRFADTRINVGEPNQPINGAAFIRDNTQRSAYLYSKLVNPVF